MINTGGDTTAVLLSRAFVILCHYKDVQIKIQQEIDSFVQKNRRYPVFEERESFPFMLSTQKECIRYNSTPHKYYQNRKSLLISLFFYTEWRQRCYVIIKMIINILLLITMDIRFIQMS